MHQLIVTILGKDSIGILSSLISTVSELHCNILDSRQAVYGQDFSLTMILEGTQTAITKAELTIPQICNQYDLLSMMKRTKQHSKQNIERLADVTVEGVDAIGVFKHITQFFAQHQITITAMRQNTYRNEGELADRMRCKMVVSIPADIALDVLNLEFQTMLSGIQLSGHITKH